MDEATYVEGFHDKDAVQKMEYQNLGKTGLRISKFALGGGPFGGIYESLEEADAVAMIREAIRSGINYIDTAPLYGRGRSEKFIGKALKGIPRKAYYIATKIGRYDFDEFDFSAEKTRQSFNTSLELLGLDYVDVIQVHDLEYAETLDEVVNETLPTLKEFVDEGRARFIGITGYPLKPLKEVAERSTVKIDTVLSYTRYTLIDDELLRYIPFFKEKGIGVINAGILAIGLLTAIGPQPWNPATQEIKDACRKAAQYCKENNIDLEKAAVQYCMNTDGIATSLIGVGSYDILKKNLKLFTKKPTEEELKQGQEIKKRFFSNLTSKNWEYNDPVFEQLKERRSKQKK